MRTLELNKKYKEGILALTATIAMGTGVIIGAGIFALTGQVAELSGDLYPLAFNSAAIMSGLSAYSYVKVSNKYPSTGGTSMRMKCCLDRETASTRPMLLSAALQQTRSK